MSLFLRQYFHRNISQQHTRQNNSARNNETSIVSFASWRQLAIRFGKCNMRQGNYLSLCRGFSPGSSFILQASNEHSKRKKINLVVTLGGPCSLTGCWRYYLLKVKADINIAIQKMGENAPNFTANVNNSLRLESIQLSVFGYACLIVLTTISSCGIFTIVS